MELIPQKDIDEMKSLNRELEDIQDNLLAIKIESALLDKEAEGLEELMANEMRRNVQLKQRVEEMRQLADAEEDEANRLAHIWSNFNKGTMAKTLSFTEGQLKELTDANESKKANLAKKLNEEIDEYLNARPLVKQFYESKAKLAEAERTIARNAEKLNALQSSSRSALEMSDRMFQLTVVDIAYFVLQYQALMRQLNNQGPARVERANPMRMLMPMRTLPLPSPVVSSIASSSKRQEQLDTDEDAQPMSGESSVLHPSTQDNDKTMDRTPCSRSEMRGKKSLASTIQRGQTENAERLKKLKASSAQSVAAKSARDEEKNENVPSEVAKRALPNTGSFKVVASSQTTMKTKVTIVDFDSAGSGFEMDFSRDEGVSTSDFHMASGNDMDEETSPDIENGKLLDDDEIPPFGENDEMSVDDEVYPEMDNQENNFDLQDFDDNTSDWSSPDPNGMEAGARFPTFKESDATEDNNFTKNSKESTDNNGFSFDFDDGDFSDCFK